MAAAAAAAAEAAPVLTCVIPGPLPPAQPSLISTHHNCIDVVLPVGHLHRQEVGWVELKGCLGGRKVQRRLL